MACLLGLIALSCPRLILVLVWLFGDGWLQSAWTQPIIPIVGFIILPLTTLAWAWAWHAGGGSVQGVGLIVVVVAFLFDLGCGSLGRNGAARRSSAESG